MALEIEIKMSVAEVDPDFSKVIAKLKTLAATPVIRLAETNIFMDRPDHSLRLADQGLRVRLEEDRDGQTPAAVIITHKGPHLPGLAKTRHETELRVADVEGAVALFSVLGFEETLRFQKHRDRWRLENCLIELDTLPLLGRFVEIEGPSEPEIQRVRQSLGLAQVPLVPSGYASMLARELDAKGIQNRVVTF